MDCMACHKVGGVGGDAGPDLSFVGFRRTADWLDRWIADPKSWKHDAKMPFMRVSPGSRRILVEYLSGLKGQGADLHGGGKRLFITVGCVACHGAGGRGGEPNVNVKGGVIPALPPLVATYTDEELANRIRKGSRPPKADPDGPEPVAMPAWGEVLSEEKIQELVAYLRGIAAKDESW